MLTFIMLQYLHLISHFEITKRIIKKKSKYINNWVGGCIFIIIMPGEHQAFLKTKERSTQNTTL